MAHRVSTIQVTGTYQNERFPSLLRLLKMPFVGIDSEALNRIGRHAAGLCTRIRAPSRLQQSL